MLTDPRLSQRHRLGYGLRRFSLRGQSSNHVEVCARGQSPAGQRRERAQERGRDNVCNLDTVAAVAGDEVAGAGRQSPNRPAVGRLKENAVQLIWYGGHSECIDADPVSLDQGSRSSRVLNKDAIAFVAGNDIALSGDGPADHIVAGRLDVNAVAAIGFCQSPAGVDSNEARDKLTAAAPVDFDTVAAELIDGQAGYKIGSCQRQTVTVGAGGRSIQLDQRWARVIRVPLKHPLTQSIDRYAGRHRW